MSSKVLSAAVVGLDAELVEVEADKGGGDIGMIAIVGLPDAAVSESKERVRSAIKNSEFFLSRVKITINLAPADLKKHGPSYDLPIAVSILLAFNCFNVDEENLKSALFVGELALNGDVRPINGVLPITIKAKKENIKTIYVPADNAAEAKLVKDIQVIPIKNLKQLVKHLSKLELIEPTAHTEFNFSNIKTLADMAHVKGQEHVKRAIEIAAAGAHNILMIGPPGSGKTLIARTIPSILPDLTLEEALEITKIYSVVGKLPNNVSLITTRPFRAPHHTASGVALIGGGAWPKPGEISMAHRGVLFLDEFGEFPKNILENLRQPLEDGIINVSRAAGTLTFPAKFILVGSMNPCPCGYYGDKKKQCICTTMQILNYKKRISGPIMDRIDIHVEVPRMQFDKLSSNSESESSKTIQQRIQKSRVIQKQRFQKTPFITNSEMNSQAVKQFCEVDAASRKLLYNAVDCMNLSARMYFRILKLARTIADLAGENKILTQHIAEALQYRPKEQ